jgi:Protein of unknown function (DUF3179)
MHAIGIQTAAIPKSASKASFFLALVATLIPIICLAIPMYVIRPFRPQDPSQLVLALTVRDLAPSIAAVCAIVVLLILFRVWRRSGVFQRTSLSLCAAIVLAGAVATHINIFEIMFHPYKDPAFAIISSVKVDPDDKVIAVQIGGIAHAYPIRAMGYHHIVNDVIGGQPIAATYCTLCHTGLIWSRIFGGQTLKFRLAGINNGNALMRDEQTSSIWQQSTGQAIYGPLKGKQLTLVHSDELTFALWSNENPTGLVLQPDTEYAKEYEDKDWEQHILKTRTVVDTSKSGIAPHELMVGITINGSSKAYPVKTILAAKVIEDSWEAAPVLILVGPDQASIRTFHGDLPNRRLTFLQPQAGVENKNALVEDQETQSLWDFRGCAIQGILRGQCLKPLDANKDYWFDWLNHHPKTTVFKN